MNNQEKAKQWFEDTKGGLFYSGVYEKENQEKFKYYVEKFAQWLDEQEKLEEKWTQCPHGFNPNLLCHTCVEEVQRATGWGLGNSNYPKKPEIEQLEVRPEAFNLTKLLEKVNELVGVINHLNSK